jgi:hypothetical protein
MSFHSLVPEAVCLPMEDEMENGILGSINAQAERWRRIGMPARPW